MISINWYTQYVPRPAPSLPRPLDFWPCPALPCPAPWKTPSLSIPEWLYLNPSFVYKLSLYSNGGTTSCPNFQISYYLFFTTGLIVFMTWLRLLGQFHTSIKNLNYIIISTQGVFSCPEQGAQGLPRKVWIGVKILSLTYAIFLQY